MRFNRLDLNLLVALDVLLDEQSVSRAAERLNMTQSATSNALSRLRNYFDDEILVQVGRSMQLTPRATVLKENVRDILVQIDATVTTKPSFNPAMSDRKFNVFVSDYTLSTLIPFVMGIVAEQSSNIRFDFLAQTDNPQKALERGEADILVIPELYSSPEHPADHLYSDEFVCVAWVENKDFGRGGLTRETFIAAPHVVMKPSNGALSFESLMMKKIGIERHIVAESFSFTTLPFLVIGTNNVTTIHKMLASKLISMLPIKTFNLPFEFPKMTQVLQWHKYRTNDAGMMWLRTVFHQAAIKALELNPDI